MASDPSLWVGAAVGVTGAFAIVFGLVAAIDNRYPTRREYAATLKDIQRQLDEIKRAVGVPARVED